MSPAEPRTPSSAGHEGTHDVRAELETPVALVVAHPGHELLAYGWLSRYRPAVFIVTDGSGRDGQARIEASARLLRNNLGARASVFGRWTDRGLYDALFEGRFEPFISLFEELTETWSREPVGTIICDAFECRILMHDVVQIVVSAAVSAVRERGLPIELLELPIALQPGGETPGDPRVAAGHRIPDEIFELKLEAARGYESAVVQREVDGFLERHGVESFRWEPLQASIQRTATELAELPRPAWEAHGEGLKESGIYDRVIRLREHVVPLAETLEKLRDSVSETR